MGTRSFDAFLDEGDDVAGSASSGRRSKGRSSGGRELEVIGGLFSGLKVAKSVKDHLRSIDLWTHWSEIVGTELSRVTVPKEFKAKSLTILVAHQAWAHQLHFLTPSILNKIRAVCPDMKVKELHFSVGEVKPREKWVVDEATWWRKKAAAASSKGALPERVADETPVALSERQEMTLRAVASDKLRAAIRKAMEASVRRSGTPHS